MNGLVGFLLSLCILLGSAVYAVKTRYQIFDDPYSKKVFIIDNWKFKTHIIERKNKKWLPQEVLIGGPSVEEFVTDMQETKKQDFKPAI